MNEFIFFSDEENTYYLCRSQEACIIFKAGKVMMVTFTVQTSAQTEQAIKIFEDNFPRTAVAAFGFDNSP